MATIIIVICLIVLLKCMQGMSEKSTPLALNTSLQSIICASDYREVVRKPLFVDKTHLVLPFLSGPFVQVACAPSRFGKSTIIDMLKRFFEIKTDKHGQLIPLKKSENYQLFVENRLEICRYKKLFDQYFGKHPVVHINFELLNEFYNEKDMMDKMKTIVHWSFIQHIYLKHSRTIWKTDTDGRKKMVFVRHINKSLYKHLKADEIKYAYRYLTKLLFSQFNRKVIILVDGYDSYLHNILFRDFRDINPILEFLNSINEDLMIADPYVMKVFITGVFHVAGNGLIPFVKTVKYRKFLSDWPLSEYFGLNTQELDILINTVLNETERQFAWNLIDTCYNGFTIKGQNKKIYNLWSVLNYLEKREIDWYWCKLNHFKYFDHVILNTAIAEALVRVIQDRCVIRMDLEAPISREIIMTTKQLIQKQVAEMSFHVDSFLVILYHLGYLTASVERRQNISISCLKVPNQEILHEFSALLRINYDHRFHYSPQDVQELNKAVDGLQPDRLTRDTFQEFHEKLNIFIQNSSHYPQSKYDIQSVIFVYLINKFPWSQTSLLLPQMNEYIDIKYDYLDLIIINDYNVQIFVEIEILETLEPNEKELEDMAGTCLGTLFEKFRRLPDGIIKSNPYNIYVGLSIQKSTRNICTAFTYLTKGMHKYAETIVIKTAQRK